MNEDEIMGYIINLEKGYLGGILKKAVNEEVIRINSIAIDGIVINAKSERNEQRRETSKEISS